MKIPTEDFTDITDVMLLVINDIYRDDVKDKLVMNMVNDD